MPTKKKALTELTTAEALRKLFPASVVHEAKEAAKRADRKATERAPDAAPAPPEPRRPESSRIIKPKGR